MSATTIGGLIGAGIDELRGGSPEEGALVGAVTANLLKAVLPVVVTYAVGWAVLRAGTQLRARVFGAPADVR